MAEKEIIHLIILLSNEYIKAISNEIAFLMIYAKTPFFSLHC